MVCNVYGYLQAQARREGHSTVPNISVCLSINLLCVCLPPSSVSISIYLSIYNITYYFEHQTIQITKYETKGQKHQGDKYYRYLHHVIIGTKMKDKNHPCKEVCCIDAEINVFNLTKWVLELGSLLASTGQ